MNRYSFLLLAVGVVLVNLGSVPGADKTPDKLKPTNLDKLNSAGDEDDPHLASNGLILLYTSTDKGKSQVLFTMRRPADKAWVKGKPLVDLPAKADCRSTFLSPEGVFPQRLYYATNKDPEKQGKGNNFDIYFLTKQFAGADFTTETALRICTEADEMHPWLTADGRQLFFSRKTKAGWRIFVTRKPPGGGQFGDDETVDLPVGFHHPTLTRDGKTMYLQGPLEKDRWGLFRTTFDGKAWARPEPLTGLNDPEALTGERSPCLSLDGAQLFFASDRAGGKGGLDLWVVPTVQLVKK